MELKKSRRFDPECSGRRSLMITAPFLLTARAGNQFNVLSYELSMPVVFVSGKFNASVTPAYVIPQNLVTVAGRPDLSERGKEMFYVTFSVGVKL